MFRYSAKKYTDSLFKMGMIRVGTLYDFRKSEHKQGIADPQEGKKEIFHPVDKIHVADSNSPEARIVGQFGFKIGKGATNVTFQNLTFARNFDVPDCFILCSSCEYSKKTMDEFEGADSCYKISNPHMFYSLITKTLNTITPVIFQGVHKVIYQDRKEKWNGRDWGHHPALIKEKEFSKQEEFRAIWQPLNGQPIHPVIIANYNLMKACQRLAI